MQVEIFQMPDGFKHTDFAIVEAVIVGGGYRVDADPLQVARNLGR